MNNTREKESQRSRKNFADRQGGVTVLFLFERRERLAMQGEKAYGAVGTQTHRRKKGKRADAKRTSLWRGKKGKSTINQTEREQSEDRGS